MIAARIVSLCPSISETLVELGAADNLAGVTQYCVRPAAVMRRLAKVGGTKTPDLGKIEAIGPDIIFANAEENRAGDIESLASRYRVHVSFPRAVSDVPGMIRELGREVGKEERAEELASRVEELRRALMSPPRLRFRFAFFIWKNPWMTVSGDTYVSDLLHYAGGENVFAASAGRYPEVSEPEISRARPDVLFFPSEPYSFSPRHLPEIRAAFGDSVAIKFLDGDDCCWHGARTVEGLKLMGSLREDLFPG